VWYVYVLKSDQNGSYYKGSTNDVLRRLQEHNAGEEKYTSKYRPWRLLWFAEKQSRSEALALERKLKNITSVSRLEAFIKKYSVVGPDAPIGGLDADKPA
jgi:putative endonuclease